MVFLYQPSTLTWLIPPAGHVRPNGAEYTNPSGKVCEGWVLKQPELAETFEGIASQGSSISI